MAPAVDLSPKNDPININIMHPSVKCPNDVEGQTNIPKMELRDSYTVNPKETESPAHNFPDSYSEINPRICVLTASHIDANQVGQLRSSSTRNLPTGNGHTSSTCEDHPNARPRNDPEFEDIICQVGFGRWNFLYILLCCLIQASNPTQYYNSIFINMPTAFRCDRSNGIALKDAHVQQHIQHYDIFDNYCGELQMVSIKDASRNFTNDIYPLSSNSSGRICTKFAYDDSFFETTFSNEFHLVCDKAWISPLFQLILVIGSILGNFFTGTSDTYGRAKMIKLTSYFYLQGALMVQFGPNIYIILSGRFLIGFCYPILTISSYSLMAETTPTKHRSMVCVMIFLPYDLFMVLLGLSAYYIRQWRMLHMLISLPIIPLPLVASFINESPRWLIQKGKFEEAYSVLKNASITNGSVLPSMLKNILEKSNENIQSNIKTSLETTSILKTLFASTKMRKISITLPLLWFFMGIVFLGVPLNANEFTTNPFLYIVMLGCLKIPMDAFGHFFIRKFGNIKTCKTSSFITGACMLVMVIIPEHLIWPKYILIGMAMILLSLIFAVISVATNEIFPTVIRSLGWTLCYTSLFSAFAFWSLLNYVFAHQSFMGINVICGLSSILTGILSMILPETHGKSLCETVDDVNNRT